ncbi:hypothetical protein [Paraburkholderia terricola]|jgi:hypothetical protein|uniref:Uncharacterized protein n=1 Tax=Paraburkholderia terricola TaxID=169427 RepID=A0A1M6LHK8_9BURK|nr:MULTISPECIES: hypothetical protein [Paraburkholderia]SDN86715.1 hypothetical protein SAMN05192547_1005120 [Paraburkholderia sediminicola]SHJ70666.1 hypothetical protein SAMN05192548_1005121 [Paraburkholderia terricola]
MPAGLQIWDASGNLVLDGTHRLGRIKGSHYLDGNSGNISMDLSDGTPFWSFQPDFLFAHINGNSPVPVVSISSTGVVWTYTSPPSQSYIYPITGNLYWGCY